MHLIRGAAGTSCVVVVGCVRGCASWSELLAEGWCLRVTAGSETLRVFFWSFFVCGFVRQEVGMCLFVIAIKCKEPG